MTRRAARLVTYAWGEEYLDKLLTFTLGSVLAPGNLPRLAAEFDCSVVIVTEARFFDYVRQHPTGRRIESICPLRLLPLDDIVGQPWQYGISLAYALFRGFAELGLSQWDKAVADFTAVIQKKPDDLQSYDRRALAYRGMKNYDAAIADYTFLLSKNPNDVEALTKRGYTYSLALQYEKAIPDYEAALKINPQDNDTFQRLQYAQSMLAKRNASPPPAASPSPTPTPEKPSLISLINPLYVGIGIVALIIIAVIVRFLTRGKAEETSNIIR